MNRKIAEWYIRNKPKILVILAIALIIIVVNIALVITMKYSDNEDDGETGTTYSVTEMINDSFNSVSMESDSALSGEELTSYQINMATVIEEFTEYCNSNNVEAAYNMLTDDCKNAVYSSLESFTNNYYNYIFNGSVRRVSVENWTNNIYKVEYTEDFLATGVYSDDNIIQDYITVIKGDDGEYKLNINNYIGREEINKTAENDYVTITVLCRDTYMDYETYTYSVTNKTGDQIILDDRNYTDSMYLEDENGNQFGAYSQEISEAELTFSQKETKQITIKYYNKYSSTRVIEKIVFVRIAPYSVELNSNNYEYTNRYQSLTISLDN